MNIKIITFFVLFSSCSLIAQINFIEDPQLFQGAALGSLAFADIDNDGDQDFLTTGVNLDLDTLTILYKNDGLGNFEEVSNTSLPNAIYGDIAFGDIDNDGDQDLVIAGLGIGNISFTKLFVNDGSGNFSEVDNSSLEPITQGKISFVDIDNDGDQDVFISGNCLELGGWISLKSQIYLNNGNGNFYLSPFEDFSTYGSFDITDVDGDKDYDILISGKSDFSSEAKAVLYLNMGNGEFIEQENPAFIGTFGATVNFADIDADNDMDVLITGSHNDLQGIARLYINDGLGNFTATENQLIPVQYSACDFADVDLDQDLDLLILGLASSSNGPITQLYSQDGNGAFSSLQDLSFIDLSQGAVEFVDVDGDSDKDLFITGFEAGNISRAKLYINDFTLTSIEPSNSNYFKAYPNPFDEFLNLNFENDFGEKTIEIINDLGQTLINEKVIAGYDIQISTYNLSSGLYFLKVNHENGKSNCILLFKN